MEIIINGEIKTMAGDSLTISRLLVENNVEMPEMVQVQVNGKFVDRKDFADRTVSDGDEVDFLYFMGGGGGLS